MFISVLTFFISFGLAQETVQPGWDREIQSVFLDSCNQGRAPEISEADMKAICSCSLEKIKARYSPSQLSSVPAQEYIAQTGAICAVGSKGNWTKLVKDQFLSACTSNPDPTVTTAQQKKICDCSLDLLEAKYDPLDLGSPEATQFAESAGAVCRKQVTGE